MKKRLAKIGDSPVFFTVKSFLNQKKASLPGWAYIVALIIGLFVIAFLIWLAVKATGKQIEILDILR